MPSSSKISSPPSSSSSSLSPTWRWGTNVLSLLSVFFFSGIIFGWAPLELMLLEEGQYHELCENDDAIDSLSQSSSRFLLPAEEAEEYDVITSPAPGSDTSCAEQMNHLNAMFTLAQFFLSFASLPVGFLLDIAPKPVHFGMAGAFQILGLLLMSISDSANGQDYFILGYSLLALGGCMTLLGAFPASFLLAKYQAGILASISCLFDGSSIIFYIFYKLNENYGYSRKQSFEVWAIIAAIVYTCLVGCWIHLERIDWKHAIKQEEENEEIAIEIEESQELVLNSEYDEIGGNNIQVVGDKSDADDEEDNLPHHHDPHFYRVYQLGLHSLGVAQQLKTWEYGLAVLFASCQMLRCNFYIMTVDDFLLGYGDDDQTYAKLFSWVLPCGIIFVPIIESTVTKLGVIKTLHATNGIGLLFGLLLFVPSLVVQAINFCLFTGFRAFLYATLNTFIAVTFGVTTMGRIIGFVFTTAAVVSLIQYPLSVWTNFLGDFIPANIILVSLCCLPIITTIWYEKSSSSSKHDDSSSSMRKDNYGSITMITSSTNRKSMLLDENASSSSLLASPGSPSLAALRRSRLEADFANH